MHIENVRYALVGWGERAASRNSKVFKIRSRCLRMVDCSRRSFGDRVQLTEIDRAGHALLPEQPEIVATNGRAFLRGFHPLGDKAEGALARSPPMSPLVHRISSAMERLGRS